MRITEAYYREGSIKRSILLENLTNEKYENKLKGNLHCGINDCPARLVYVEKQFHGRTIAYLRTWQDEKHTPGCVNEVIQEKNGRPKRTSVSVEVTLTDNHLKQIMRDTYMVASGKKKASSSRNRIKGNSPQSNGGDTGVEETTIGTGTLSETAGDKKVDRHENVYKVPVDDINDSHVDSLHSVWGPLGDIIIEESKIRIYFKTSNGKAVYAYFGEQFRHQFGQAFSLIGNVEVYANLLNKKDAQITFSVLGSVQYREGEFVIPVNRDFAFAVNGNNVYKLSVSIEKIMSNGEQI